jgi:hypothetical protein
MGGGASKKKKEESKKEELKRAEQKKDSLGIPVSESSESTTKTGAGGQTADQPRIAREKPSDEKDAFADFLQVRNNFQQICIIPPWHVINIGPHDGMRHVFHPY